MCGIVGIINRTSATNYKLLTSMMDVQKHRGPNDTGMCCVSFSNSQIIDCPNEFESHESWLGFNRLSIRDLSLAGHQPMISSDYSAVIIFNGEIYNADEYREVLCKKGYSFKSTSDTEVILNMYLEYGIENTLPLLNGMFSFVIADIKKNKIYMARDRYGIKPFYYWTNGDKIIFASELKSIIQDRDVPREIDKSVLSTYLSFNSNYDEVMLAGVSQLKPGTFLTISRDLSINEQVYWDPNSYKRSSKHSSKSVKSLFEKSVTSQLVSDVKVGCQLSGGVDSSIVTFFAKKNGTSLDDSISIIFDDPTYNEEKYIDFVNEQLGVNPHKSTLDSDYVLSNWKRAIWHLDTIPMHPNSLGILKLANEANNWVTVLLSGEGADELWGGYNEYPQSLLIYAYLLLRRFGIKIKKYDTKYFEGTANFSNYLINIHKTPYFNMCKTIFPEFDIKKEISIRRHYASSLKGNYLDKVIKFNIRYYLPELLNRQDKMSMANSIENRVPFLDNDFVEAALTCKRSKLLGIKFLKKKSLREMLQGKKIIKDICEESFGTDFTYRSKCGFSLPLKSFLLSSQFKAIINSQLLPQIRKRNLFDYNAVTSLYNNLECEPDSSAELLWRIFSTEIWCQCFID